MAQEAIGRSQRLHRGRRQQLPLLDQIQRSAGGTHLQHLVLAAADQLEYLGNEFDFADAARAQLDIVRQVAPRHFAPDLHVQVAHGGQGAEIQVFAVDEGLHQFHQPGRIPGEGAALDPGIAFPFAALGDEVFLQRGEAGNHRSAVAVGPQAQVDAEHIAVRRDFRNDLGQLAAEQGEVLMVGNPAWSAGLAVFRIDVDEVDVRGDIQFAAAQLAHADDDQLLSRAAFRAHGRAMAFAQPGIEAAAGMGDGDFGQGADRGHHFLQIGTTGEVACQQAQVDPFFQLAQGAFEPVFICKYFRGQLGFHVCAGPGQFQRAGKPVAQLGLCQQQALGVTGVAQGKIQGFVDNSHGSSTA